MTTQSEIDLTWPGVGAVIGFLVGRSICCTLAGAGVGLLAHRWYYSQFPSGLIPTTPAGPTNPVGANQG